jgi:hypothetical protein
MREGDVLVFSSTITFDDATGRVTRVQWSNPSPRRMQVTIITPTKADLVTVIEPGASGQRNVNQNQGYFIDGPQGAGYQVWQVP